VIHRQHLGQQGNLLVGQWRVGTVAQVAEYRMAQPGQLKADLMAPAGFQIDLQQTEAIGPVENPIAQAGFPAGRGG
jgi:hypothetical protein